MVYLRAFKVEIDCIIDQGERLVPLEVKSGKTVSEDFFKGLRFWSRISGAVGKEMYLVYAGLMDQRRQDGNVLSWKTFGSTIALEM